MAKDLNDAPLRLFNSLTRRIEPFAPIDPQHVRVYSCGPTVYNFQHIGNMRAYVFADTLGRALRWKGYGLTHVINITDVGHLTSDADVGNDKMEAAARRTGKSAWDIAAFYAEAFKRDVERLNIAPPARWSVATDHIGEMIEFAGKIAPAHCYELDTGLYFDATTVPDYGRLAGAAGGPLESRIDNVAGKRHPQDFAIWRKTDPGEHRQMEWDSPWGRGAPGWHLECSVMSMKYLGEQFDIHTGGIDHREIHHPNEIAQNQAYTDSSATGANIWMHNNFLIDREGKMSKSKGEFLTLQALVDRGVHPLAYRLMCLQAHYRSELEFTWENLTAARRRLGKMAYAAEQLAARADCDQLTVPSTSAEARRLLDRFDKAMSDDLMTPQAIPVFEEALWGGSPDASEALDTVSQMDRVLGLGLPALTRADLRLPPKSADINGPEIEVMIERRVAARAAKDWIEADAIRDQLAARGVEIMDGDPLRWEWKIPFPDKKTSS